MWVQCLILVALLNGLVSGQATNCDPTCTLPNCRCSGSDIPGGIDAKKTPQMILLTFDDAVSQLLYTKYYKDLIERKNPNGCNIGVTFFASHEYCDYSIVRSLYEAGHEIAIHSITHKADIDYWKNGDLKMWTDEMDGMRKILQTYAGIPKRDLKGIRVPFLQIGGNTQFQMMANEGFLWDCSMPTQNQVTPGLWPYSLKHIANQDCQIPPCPTDSFPSVWVVPMLDLFDAKGIACAMLDTCIVKTKRETYELLKTNFLAQYNGTRAPYGLYVHAAWFLQDIDESDGHWAGYLQFIDEIIKNYDDVYFVTVSQALQWTRYPADTGNIKNYSAWKTQCIPPKVSKPCIQKTCQLTKTDPFSGGERWMTACFEKNCPNCYPWVGKPDGSC